MREQQRKTYVEVFEKMKEIGKELLFSGAGRLIQNRDGLTPLDLLESHPEMLRPADKAKMVYVLSPPKKCQCLRLTRPIQKVERTTTTQLVMLLFDVINMAFFVIAVSYN